jgi:hypothetical protein
MKMRLPVTIGFFSTGMRSAPAMNSATAHTAFTGLFCIRRLYTIENDARRHAQQGIFWPPYARVAWAYNNTDRHAAMEAYSKAYWAEYNRLRFERGDYELI